jgi:hypothetical protein
MQPFPYYNNESMIIAKIHPESNWLLSVISEDGRSGTFDIGPYLEFEAFKALRDIKEFTGDVPAIAPKLTLNTKTNSSKWKQQNT